jgi:integrase
VRLALALYLNLGIRKSDVVRIGPRHIRDGTLHNFLPQKGSRTGGHRISVRLFEETSALIAATPVTGTETNLVTSFGKAFTANGFGNKMREWCDEAGLPDCTSHGLRKLMMIRFAHAGYSAPQIGAISGHKDLREIQLYIEQMNRAQMAIEIMTSFEQVQRANKNLLTE